MCRKSLRAAVLMLVLLLSACSYSGTNTDDISSSVNSPLSTFDVPVDPRPYYEQMQIRKPMPSQSGETILYPVTRCELTIISTEKYRYFSYFINEKGETVIPVGKYRRASYIYDDKGMEAFLLCESVRKLDESNPEENSNIFEYDIIDFSGKVLDSFQCYDAYPLDYGAYVVIQNEPYEYGEDAFNNSVYDVNKKSVYFSYPGRVYSENSGKFIVSVINYSEGEELYYNYDPETQEQTPIPDDIAKNYSIWEEPEERTIKIMSNSDDEDTDDEDTDYYNTRLLVCGSYYFDIDKAFIGYKNKDGEWLFRDILEKSAVSGIVIDKYGSI